jgi:hypothetical protein
MIDGFGWFHAADYQRAYLLFEEVDYVLPQEIRGPLWYPLSVYKSSLYQVAHQPITIDCPDIVQRLRDELQDPALIALLRRAPSRDLEYATNVIRTDPEMSWLEQHLPEQLPEAAVLMLANKLLSYAAHTGTIPIVGQEYCWNILSRKVSKELLSISETMPRFATASQKVLLSKLNAGLALAFLRDEELVSVSAEDLAEFKQNNSSLLHRHHLHILEIAQQYSEIPEDGEFDQRLAALQLQALRKQQELDENARDAWLGAGFSLLEKAAVAGIAAAIPLTVFVRNASAFEVLAAVLPGLGLAVAAGLDTAKKIQAARKTPFAYLFRAGRLR